MKCLLKNLDKIQCVKVPPTFVLKSVFFVNTLTWGATAPQALHLPHQTKPFPPSQSKALSLEQRKEMTFNRRLANITDRVLAFRGLYCPYSEHLVTLHEITGNSQG